MADSKRRNGKRRTDGKHRGPIAAEHASHPRANVDAGRPPSDENDALPAALTFDVDASRETTAPDGVVDDDPRIDREFREDVDEPDAVCGRRRG